MKNFIVLSLALLSFNYIFAQVPKNFVLVEVGSSMDPVFTGSIGTSLGANDLVLNGHQVAIIQNNGMDDFETENTFNRNQYYYIHNFPTTIFNGTHETMASDSYTSLYSEYLPIYNSVEGDMSDFYLSLNYSHTGLDYDATIYVNEVGEYLGENLKIHLVLTESHVPVSWESLDEINFVNRMMIPSYNGTSYSGGEETLELDFSIDPSWEQENLELIVFIQDDTTKEVLQVSKASLAIPVGVNNADLADFVEIDNTCMGTISPKILVKNKGAADITSMEIDYSINDGATTGTYSWSGDAISSFENTMISIGNIDFDLLDTNDIVITISSVNGEADDDDSDNSASNSFNQSDINASYNTIQIELRTDNYGDETTWELKRVSDDFIIYSGGPYANNTTYTISESLEANTCYSFTVFDTGGNGICCEYGEGYFYVQSGSDFLFDGGDFENQHKVSFNTEDFLATDDLALLELNLYPNPASTSFTILNAKGYDVQVYDVLGREVLGKRRVSNIEESVSISTLKDGAYFVKVSNISESRILRLAVRK